MRKLKKWGNSKEIRIEKGGGAGYIINISKSNLEYLYKRMKGSEGNGSSKYGDA